MHKAIFLALFKRLFNVKGLLFWLIPLRIKKICLQLYSEACGFEFGFGYKS